MKGPFPDEVHGTIKVGERGQVVIPLEVRNKLGIKKNDRLFIVTKNRLVMLAKTEDLTRYISGFLKEAIAIKKKISSKKMQIR